MGRASDYAAGPLLPQQFGSGADRATRVDHVINEDCGALVHIPDHRETLGHVVTRASFVDDGQGSIIHLLGKGSRPCHSTHIG